MEIENFMITIRLLLKKKSTTFTFTLINQNQYAIGRSPVL